MLYNIHYCFLPFSLLNGIYHPFSCFISEKQLAAWLPGNVFMGEDHHGRSRIDNLDILASGKRCLGSLVLTA